MSQVNPQAKQMILDNIKAENRMLRAEILNMQQAQEHSKLMEMIMCHAVAGAATRFGPKEAADYAIRTCDEVMLKFREVAVKPEVQQDATA